MSAARSASRCTPTPTRWRRWRCRSCSSGRSSSSPTGIESFVTDIHARDHRVQGQDRRQERRHHHGVRDRRPHRHRPLLGLSAHLGHRGQPDRQPDRRPLHLRRTIAPAPAWCSRTKTSCASTARSAIRSPCAVTEGLVELAAAKIGMDPLEIRRRNLIADDAYPCASAPRASSSRQLSHHAALAQARSR